MHNSFHLGFIFWGLQKAVTERVWYLNRGRGHVMTAWFSGSHDKIPVLSDAMVTRSLQHHLRLWLFVVIAKLIPRDRLAAAAVLDRNFQEILLWCAKEYSEILFQVMWTKSIDLSDDFCLCQILVALWMSELDHTHPWKSYVALCLVNNCYWALL